MRIKKTSQYIEGGASLSNVYGTSQSNGYTQEYINSLIANENFESQVTFNETRGSYNLFRKVGSIVIINYQGENKAHTTNDLIFTLPTGYRPVSTICVPFTGYGTLFGQIVINTDGTCIINSISNTTSTARICFTATFTTTDTAQNTRSITSNDEVEEDSENER